ncbi:hypothetical protein BWQ96_08929 [Gracilariopsis chorda]|uniref:Uncharacterized protein n=1 Tax=Gracilariopsis chorda TaxID=448386 RepID=A0A2V3IH07_9FLOR|nr:hypothetical protein BWQ96_08929 [Gracilariopsis chorda]|eukprot:PXF41359.1 hypothetical protein BWQ96_08929 [Gracilariopsis chorda]
MQSTIPGLSPNVISKLPIQKKTPESDSRRSPSSNGSGRGPKTWMLPGVMSEQSMCSVPNANLQQRFSCSFPILPIPSNIRQANPQRANIGGSVLHVLTAMAGNQDRFNFTQQFQRPGPPNFVGTKAGAVARQMKEAAHESSSINSSTFQSPTGVEIGG